jgi:hypothetical protein
VQCHAPQKKVDGHLVGGVRYDCTGCHNYHHGTMPLLGPGSAIYDPKKKMSIDEFLKYAR